PDAQDWHMHSQPIITRGTLIATPDARRTYSGRVLLVEDNQINQRVARRFLERLGCEVEVVEDGAQAIEAFKRNQYGFILMDMQMPVMDGIEATRRIREIEAATERPRTPIVALPANAMMGTWERCVEAGMDDYLPKPLDISRLQAAVDRFMGAFQGDSPMSNDESRVAAAAGAGRSLLQAIAGADAEFMVELIEAFLTTG